MPGFSLHLRLGLRSKVLLTVSMAVLAAAGAGGWLCFAAGHPGRAAAALIAASAAIALCAATTGYLLVWRITIRPLRNLATAARRAAAGSFGGPIGIKRRDEIGRLAEAVEAMSGALAASADEFMLAKSRSEQETARGTDELEFANHRLREEIAKKEHFLRAVSHDLNAPLRNISGMAAMALAKDGAELPPELAARLKRIQANADMAGEMISELLELSRIKSLPQKRQAVDVAELIAEQAKVFDFELSSRNIVLETKGPMPVLYADRALIRKAFQNLVDNAIKYMDKPSGGTIEAGYELVEEFHRFCVADNGPGIPLAEQESIFRPFHRAASALAAKVEGKGVGLATVATVAAEYGGVVWVESAPGQGARFYITFSVAGTLPPGPSCAAQTAKAAPESHKPDVRLAGPAGPSGQWKTT
jgi:signal transduction histidine kinase